MTPRFWSSEWFSSVEPVWGAWLLSLCLLAVIALAGIRLRQPQAIAWRTLWLAEDGAAYTLSYVFSFPIVMLVVCVAVETSLILLVKTGTVYAAHAAARSAVVWVPAVPNNPGLAQQKVKLAAVQAMVPFAEGNERHTARLGKTLSAGGAGSSYHAAYKKYAEGDARAPQKYLALKYSYAEQATSVDWSPRQPVENADLNLTLTYRMPLHIPGAARVLGQADGEYVIVSRAKMQNEGPKRESTYNPDRPLGIDYRPRP